MSARRGEIEYAVNEGVEPSLRLTAYVTYIAAIVLAELVWVLESCYRSTKSEIVTVLERTLRTRQLIVQDAETVWKAVRLFETSKADFADCLIERSGAMHDCEYAATFDKGAADAGMRLIA